jgi:hypothetical protein
MGVSGIPSPGAHAPPAPVRGGGYEEPKRLRCEHGPKGTVLNRRSRLRTG